VTPVALLGIGFIAATIIYTIVRFSRDGNLEKDTLAIFIGGMLVGLTVIYFYSPPFNAFVRNLARNLGNLIFFKY
jgi:hypothetical protein